MKTGVRAYYRHWHSKAERLKAETLKLRYSAIKLEVRGQMSDRQPRADLQAGPAQFSEIASDLRK